MADANWRAIVEINEVVRCLNYLSTRTHAEALLDRYMRANEKCGIDTSTWKPRVVRYLKGEGSANSL